jgi:hypothetical protein
LPISSGLAKSFFRKTPVDAGRRAEGSCVGEGLFTPPPPRNFSRALGRRGKKNKNKGHRIKGAGASAPAGVCLT